MPIDLHWYLPFRCQRTTCASDASKTTYPDWNVLQETKESEVVVQILVHFTPSCACIPKYPQVPMTSKVDFSATWPLHLSLFRVVPVLLHFHRWKKLVRSFYIYIFIFKNRNSFSNFFEPTEWNCQSLKAESWLPILKMYDKISQQPWKSAEAIIGEVGCEFYTGIEL